MKIVKKQQDIYHVDLSSNGKSLKDHILELRKKQPPKITNEVLKTSVPEPVKPSVPTEVQTPIENSTQLSNETKLYQNRNSMLETSFDLDSKSVPTVPPIVNTSVPATLVNNSNKSQSTIQTNSVAKQPPPPPSEPKNDNENLLTLINEQRRQNRLLEQVIAAINTTNALLTQLVQRDY